MGLFSDMFAFPILQTSSADSQTRNPELGRPMYYQQG